MSDPRQTGPLFTDRAPAHGPEPWEPLPTIVDDRVFTTLNQLVELECALASAYHLAAEAASPGEVCRLVEGAERHEGRAGELSALVIDLGGSPPELEIKGRRLAYLTQPDEIMDGLKRVEVALEAAYEFAINSTDLPPAVSDELVLIRETRETSG